MKRNSLSIAAALLMGICGVAHAQEAALRVSWAESDHVSGIYHAKGAATLNVLIENVSPDEQTLEGEIAFGTLIGGKGEDDLSVQSQIVAASRTEPIQMAGKTSIAELIALLSLSKGHVGGDTGSSHLAAGLGIPAIGLYSITRPVRSCPYGQIDRCHFDSKGLDYIMPEAVEETFLKAVAA